MKNLRQIIFIVAAIATGAYFMALAASAQTADSATTSNVTSAEVPVPIATSSDDIKQEEAKGGEIWNNLQAKKIECPALIDDDYELLGEYFMGQRLGDSHEAMNDMMKRMMGEVGEVRMHIALGQRLSGCLVNVQYPANGSQFLPMMGMMGDYWTSAGLTGGNLKQPNYNHMMNYGYQTLGFFGPLFMVLFWALIIFGVIALVKWSGSSSRDVDTKKDKTPLEILKERYAKGEIDKKEFEEKKKSLMD